LAANDSFTNSCCSDPPGENWLTGICNSGASQVCCHLDAGCPPGYE
jgi:hypothetical protein